MSVAVSTAAQTVQERIMAADTFLTAPLDRTLENPALAGYRLPVGISELNAGFAQQGGVTRQGYFDAQTYLRTGNATIEGHASYHNGFRLNSGIYENANPELLYPYLTADEVGGRLDDEIYSFGGAYNTALADSTWLIGVEGAYTAILECRRRDPRPKNTVGNLEVAVGGARRVADYWIALGAESTSIRLSTARSRRAPRQGYYRSRQPRWQRRRQCWSELCPDRNSRPGSDRRPPW